MKTHFEYLSSRCFPARITKPKMRLACAVSLAILWVACGETNGKVFQRYESQFNERRQQFKKIAGALPAPGSVKGASSANLSPKPVYDEKNSGSSNTEIVMYDQLLDPDIQSEGNKRLDLLLSANLLTGMRWTGLKSPMSPSAKSNPDMEQTLKQALSERYLVVLRPVNYVAPVATDENKFKPGMADIEGFIVDLPDQKVAGSFRYTAQSSDRVEYSSRKGASGEARQAQLEKFAYSSLYEDARKKLKPLLEQTTAGSFALNQ